MRRWRARTVAVLLAAALPFAASGSVAQAAPSAQARLVIGGQAAPDTASVVAIAQFKRRRLRAQGPRARALATMAA